MLPAASFSKSVSWASLFAPCSNAHAVDTGLFKYLNENSTPNEISLFTGEATELVGKEMPLYPTTLPPDTLKGYTYPLVIEVYEATDPILAAEVLSAE